MFIRYRFILITILAVVIIPFRVISNVWIAILVVAILLFLIYILYKIVMTKKQHTTSFKELRESKKILKDGGFLFDKLVQFGNVVTYNINSFNIREFTNFQVKEKGLLIRPWISLGFGIKYNEINKFELIEIYDPANRDISYYFVRIYVTYQKNDEEKTYMFKFKYVDELIDMIRIYYNGDIIFKDYKGFIEELKNKELYGLKLF